jgi:hypothetical protein
MLASLDRHATAALREFLGSDCELLAATDQLGRRLDVFHPIAYASVIDMDRSSVRRRDDAQRTIDEVRDLVYDPAVAAAHRVVRDSRIPRHGCRWSAEAATFIEELSEGAVRRLDVSWW